MIKTTDDIKQLGTILGVWAHPDDETYSMGGIMAAAVNNGQVVACLTATRGEAGVQDENRWPAASLGEIRTHELETAMEILRVQEHCWLDFPDGGCNKVSEQDAVKQVADCIEKYRPDTILTFGPDGLTGHPDHQTVSKWAKLARDKTASPAVIYHAVQTYEQYDAMIEADKQFNIFFKIDKPPVCATEQCAIHFELDDELYRQKLTALKAMPSQTEAMLGMFEHSLRSSLGREAFVESK